MKIALVGVAAVLLSFVLFTWWALEWSGVATLETRAPDGSLRSTHVWFAEPDGELWLEAGTPENPWYLDARRDPRISFSSERRSGEYVAQPVGVPADRDRIRRLLREKYGLRDWWIGVLFDTSRSVAVELVAPASSGSSAGRHRAPTSEKATKSRRRFRPSGRAGPLVGEPVIDADDTGAPEPPPTAEGTRTAALGAVR